MNKEKMNLTAVAIAALFLMNGLSFAEPESKGSAAPPDKGYTYNLKELIEKAKENIKRVDKELTQKAVEERNMQKEAKAQEHFEKGNILYEQGKLQEAKREWQKALEITKSPELEEYIKLSEKKAKDRELARQKEEKDRQARIKQEQARFEKERKDKGRLARQEAEKKEQARLEAEEKARKEKQAAERKAKEDAEQARLEKERKEKQEQARLEKQRQEKEAAEKGKQKSGQNFKW